MCGRLGIRPRTLVIGAVLAVLGAFFAWRMLRPLHIFVIGKRFERPVPTAAAPAVLGTLSAKQCGSCHPANYREWRTTMHAQAWTDPYFRADWRHEGREQICRNCHIDLWDARLAYRKPRTYRFSFSTHRTPRPAELEVRVRYHLAPAAYARRIGYRPRTPLAYTVYRRVIRLAPRAEADGR